MFISLHVCTPLLYPLIQASCGMVKYFSPSIPIHDKKCKKVKEGYDQEMVQSERNSHSKNGLGKITIRYLYYSKKTYRRSSEQLFSNRRSLSYTNLTKIRKRTYGANSTKINTKT